MRFSLAAALSGLLAAGTAWAAPAFGTANDIAARKPAAAGPGRLVWQFAPDVWVENIAVRPNGNLLLTTLTPNGSLYEVVDPSSKQPSLIQHFTIDKITGISGIAELTNDKFIIFGGSASFAGGGVVGSWHAWTVDFTSSSMPAAVPVADLPQAEFLNGASSDPSLPYLALICDSKKGVVYSVCSVTGKVTEVQDRPEMHPASTGTLNLGINGVRLYLGYLWWTNWDTRIFYRLRVRPDGTTAPGAKVEVVATETSLPTLDDFTFDGTTAFIATNAGQNILRVTQDGDTTVAAAGSGDTTLTNASAVKFGRSATDKKTIYVTTTGDTQSIGGRVVAFDSIV